MKLFNKPFNKFNRKFATESVKNEQFKN